MCEILQQRRSRVVTIGVLLSLLVLLQVSGTNAAFNWTLDGVTHTQPAVQLWYEGYWKEVWKTEEFKLRKPVFN